MNLAQTLTALRTRLSSARRRFSRRRVSEALLTVAGASRDVLVDAPKERTKQVAMGAVLCSTAGIAAVSASYALHIALHLWWIVAVVGGLAWGLVILNLDRWLVVSTPRLKTKLGTLAMALPRVLLAILIGAVISTPLTLAVFSAEINAQVKVMAAEQESAFTTQLQQDSRYKHIPDWQNQIQALQTDIRTPVSDADVLKDPTVSALTKRLGDVTAQYDAAAQAVVAESDGSGGTGVPGHGQAYYDKVAERDRLQQEMNQLQTELDSTKTQVLQQLKDEDVKKTADEKVELTALQKQLSDAEKARDAEIAEHKAAVGSSDGILARLAALEQLQSKDPLLGAAHLLLFLFMTALECLPIIFKTMLALAPPSLYERLVKLDEERVEARVRLRMQTEYEEAETLARSAVTAAEARAARTLEAESKATSMVLNAQLAVTREGVRRWREDRLEDLSGDGALNIVEPGPHMDTTDSDFDGVYADELDEELRSVQGSRGGNFAGSTRSGN